MGFIKCVKCGHENNAQRMACVQCGAELPALPAPSVAQKTDSVVGRVIVILVLIGFAVPIWHLIVSTTADTMRVEYQQD